MVRGEQGAALRHLEFLFDVGTIGSPAGPAVARALIG